MNGIDKIEKNAVTAISNVETLKDLDDVRIEYLSRKGELNTFLRSLKNLSLEEKREVGPKVNSLKDKLNDLINKKRLEIEKEIDINLIDVTKPGEKINRGHIHPLTKIQNEICDIFKSLNFSVINGPEIESEYYNFDALNIPPGHPARDMWDTFWIDSSNKDSKKNLLLRTHTSPVQVRYMEQHQPPFQIIAPGRTFRYEAVDSSHDINFYQLEGLMVGDDVNFANLKYIIEEFLNNIFNGKIEFRFRPSYFPFTEPSVEVDVKLPESHPQGGKWLEILGAGMVNKRVFDAAHYNSKEIQGFAFGVGIDRIAMVKYNIPDIRFFYSGDLRFIKQF